MNTDDDIQNIPAAGAPTNGYPNVGNTTGTADYGHGSTHRQPHAQRDWGNPLAHTATNDSEMRVQAFGGAFQPGLYRPPSKKLANPAPLGLSAFALTTFVLSLINMRTKGVNEPNLVVAAAFGYGGLVQLLAGMWYVFNPRKRLIPKRSAR
jgi:hypothetical protein